MLIIHALLYLLSRMYLCMLLICCCGIELMIRNLAAIIHLWNNLQLSFKEEKKVNILQDNCYYLLQLLGIYISISILYKKCLHIYSTELYVRNLCDQN